MDNNFKKTPIPIPKAPWDWVKSHEPIITETHEPLINAEFFPEKILSSPEYYIQQLPGSILPIMMRKSVYLKIVEATNLLPDGYKFVLLDSWRSNETQLSLFNSLKEQLRADNPKLSEAELLTRTRTTVAPPSSDPSKPSPHNTGGSVDLTIVNQIGIPLEFGTPFDDCTKKARATYYEEKLEADEKLTDLEILYMENRRLLYHIMTNSGFTHYFDEWWHFDYGNQNWAWVSGHDKAIYGPTKPIFVWNDPIG